MEIRRIEPWLWEIPVSGDMRVPGRVYASDALMEEIQGDESLNQVRNVGRRGLPAVDELAIAFRGFHGVAQFEQDVA